MKLLVVIVNFRVPELTVQCLQSLEPEVQQIPGCRVVVCENGSGDNSVEVLTRAIQKYDWGSWVELLVSSENLGFTGGNNLAIRPTLASADPPDYVLLLNPDTTVRADSLLALLRFMDGNPRAGVAGSRLLNPDGTEQGSPFRDHSWISELDRGLRLGIVSRLARRWQVPMPKPVGCREVHWVSGASLMVRRVVLEQVGLLDEGLFTYFDDADYCLRARRAGWQVWFVPESVVVHYEGASSGVARRFVTRRPAYWFQARQRYFLKNFGAFYTALADAAFILGYAIWRVRRVIQRKPDENPPHFLGDFVRHSVFFTGFRLKAVENPAMKSNPVTQGNAAWEEGTNTEARRAGAAAHRSSNASGTADAARQKDMRSCDRR